MYKHPRRSRSGFQLCHPGLCDWQFLVHDCSLWLCCFRIHVDYCSILRLLHCCSEVPLALIRLSAASAGDLRMKWPIYIVYKQGILLIEAGTYFHGLGEVQIVEVETPNIEPKQPPAPPPPRTPTPPSPRASPPPPTPSPPPPDEIAGPPSEADNTLNSIQGHEQPNPTSWLLFTILGPLFFILQGMSRTDDDSGPLWWQLVTPCTREPRC